MDEVTSSEPQPVAAHCDTRPDVRGRTAFFPDVSDAEWNDWNWQLSHRITSVEALAKLVPMSQANLLLARAITRDFRMGVTPYWLSLVDPSNPSDPMMRQMIPNAEEYLYRNVGEEDPLFEEEHSPVPGITHRYPDRVLFVVSNVCASYCRYCTRKRMMYEDAVPDFAIDKMIAYIANTPAVRDVVVSGGDPFTFATPKLESILQKLRAIPHVEIIRIGSRVPSTMPQRITDELCAMLQRYHPLWVNVHFSHPRECTPEATTACDKLLRAGVPLNCQTVLLKGVNDSVETMRELVHALARMRVRPYYLYQCDPVRGAEHFRTTVAKGIEIIEGLRSHTSGLCVPTYVIDAPGGGGKVPVGPDYLIDYDREHGRALLRNFKGNRYAYHEPVQMAPEIAAGLLAEATTPAKMSVGPATVGVSALSPIVPATASAAQPRSTTARGRSTVGKSKWAKRAQRKPS